MPRRLSVNQESGGGLLLPPFRIRLQSLPQRQRLLQEFKRILLTFHAMSFGPIQKNAPGLRK